MGEVLDGKALALEIRAGLADRVAAVNHAACTAARV